MLIVFHFELNFPECYINSPHVDFDWHRMAKYIVVVLVSLFFKFQIETVSLYISNIL